MNKFQENTFRPKDGGQLIQAISENRPCEMPEVFARKAVTYLLASNPVQEDVRELPSLAKEPEGVITHALVA